MQYRTFEVWSYLIGLGRVGDPFTLRRKWIVEDLDMHRSAVSFHIYELVRADAVRKLGPDLYVVLERIPAMSWDQPRRPALIPYMGRAA